MEERMTRNEHIGDETALEAINKTRTAHVAALNAGDAEACAAQFTSDGLQMPPNVPTNEGRATIRSCSQALADQYRSQFALAVDEVRIAGDWAFERGGYTNSLTPIAGGPPMQDVGKYIMIYQREQGDTWLIACDIWNSNNPPPGA